MTRPMPRPGSETDWKFFFSWIGRHPVAGIFLVSLLAVVINCYPVIFCGRSFVSPVRPMPMVYSAWPSLPGMPVDTPQVNKHGSDVGAMMWYSVPTAFIESRAVLDQGELPLWNRYGHSGDTFIGQFVTMLGDPLQWIVILGRGAALAWDIKFLAAKFLFCSGFGLLVLRLLGSGPLALIYAALAAYCGAFFYINNHPAFFVLSYSPWILVSAMGMLDPRSRHPIRWGLLWLLADAGCFSGGEISAAVILIGGLNLVAVTRALALGRAAADRINIAGRMAASTLLFLGLTAPLWMSFLGALAGAYSGHSDIRVIQMPLRCLPGIFDDSFFLLTVKTIPFNALFPEAGLLVLVGCLFSVLKWKQFKSDPFFWINGVVILLVGGCMFGWVPAPVLETIPMFNRIGHAYFDLAYLLVVLLTLQSAYGFFTLAGENHFPRTALVFLAMALALEGMIVAGHELVHRPVPWNYFLIAGGGAIGAPLLFVVLRRYHFHTRVAGWVGIVFLGLLAQHRFGLYASGDNDVLLVPGPRVVLNAPSRAIEKIQADSSGPFRTTGLQRNLTGDYPAVYGLEDIRSCAPVENADYIQLVGNFPGVRLREFWIIDILDPARAQPLLNLLNVKYLLANPGFKLSAPGYHVTDRMDFTIIENPEAWPRAFFSDQIVAIPSNDAFIRYLGENAKQPFIAMTPEEIEREPDLRPLTATAAATISPATHYQLRVNSTAFDIQAPSPGVVCLTETEARDFTVQVNDAPGAVLTVNRAFKGVYLDKPGQYHLVFTYRPRHWRLACMLFWITLAGVTALVAAKLFQHKRKCPAMKQAPDPV